MNDVLLWKGCTYRNQLKKELNSITRVLKKFNIPYSTIDEECCGYPLFLSGYIKAMKKDAIQNAKKLAAYETIITACPACIRAFIQVYEGQLGIKLPNVLHITQFLVKKMKKENIKMDYEPIELKIMYHDPCELGRELGIYEEPRELLGFLPGIKLFRQRFTMENSACCGGGGLLPAFSPSLSTIAAARKLINEDQIPDDLDAVVTTCPQCIVNIRKGLEMWVDTDVHENLEVLDLVQLVDRFLR